MSGRARPQARRRGRLSAVGLLITLVIATCTVWALYSARNHAGVRPRNAKAENSPMDAPQGSERDVVPDACDVLSASIADSLAPGADRSETSATQTDGHSECAWSVYAAPRSRQLTVELRAVAGTGGTSATTVAGHTFDAEWSSDRSGKNLADSNDVRDSHAVSGVGEQAYVVYTVDDGAHIGAAVANARLANLLVTVHYAGGDHLDAAGTPLPSKAAMDGALSATRDILTKLESHS